MVLAAIIVVVSLWYTDNLVERLKAEEQVKVKLWAEATRIIASTPTDDNVDMTYPLSIVSANNTIPVIVTLEDGTILTHRNLDSVKSKDKNYLLEKIENMKSENDPIVAEYDDGMEDGDGTDKAKLIFYYENSILYTNLKYYPYVQLAVVALFLLISYLAFSYSRRSEQNQVWVGMSKETAHQLGTPISSLLAWIELIKENQGQVSEEIVEEMSRDLSRLELITERFSKIGSEPVLKPENVHHVVEDTVKYLKRRLPSRVRFTVSDSGKELTAKMNIPLFAWVIENLTKNAVDAMNGEGELTYTVGRRDDGHIFIDVSDTGKGIPSNKFSTIFEPGYTTKKRGWGLGLSLVKRIVDNYHRGSIYVKESIPNKQTTFRIILRE
ncbi:MAG: hypothetical protein GC181_04495 [Bacteroidetes bacterium]|nr:hypothetical protein [Bacteroidota bacterium]